MDGRKIFGRTENGRMDGTIFGRAVGNFRTVGKFSDGRTENFRPLGRENKIKNGGTISFEKTKALISIDIDSSKRDLSSGGINKLTEDALDLCLHLIRLRSTSGLIVIDMPRLKKADYNERFDQLQK